MLTDFKTWPALVTSYLRLNLNLSRVTSDWTWTFLNYLSLDLNLCRFTWDFTETSLDLSAVLNLWHFTWDLTLASLDWLETCLKLVTIHLDKLILIDFDFFETWPHLVTIDLNFETRLRLLSPETWLKLTIKGTILKYLITIKNTICDAYRVGYRFSTPLRYQPK